MRGSVSPFYHTIVRNKLTDEIILCQEDEPNDFENLEISNVWDVPEYLDVRQKQVAPHIKVIKIRQYKGFLIDLTAFKKIDGFLASQLSSRNRKKLRAKKNKLESEHSTQYTFYYGAIEKDEYHMLFSEFYRLLENRFQEKKVLNHNLAKWDYYHTLAYPLILEKRASLFVVCVNNRPINIALQFHLANTVFSYIQSYDIAFSRYNMGDISMMKRLAWCFENGFNVVDLSMGETDYKIKWCNHQYDIYFHLFYNSNSITAILKSNMAIIKLKLKQYLRDKDILGKFFRYDKFKYRIRNLRA